MIYDGLGRTTEARQYEGGTNYIAVQTQYDALGRVYKTSNPFRPWQSEGAVWTTSAFDALGRVTSVTTPDSAVVSTAYSGNTVTVTDQAGKARKSLTDGLGRLATVYEDPSGLNYSTSYTYDLLDDLTAVSQGVQTRTFVYDSLKRLTSAANPESGTINYQYDANGNLTGKTDARVPAVTTTYNYDALNRAITRSYSDGTPTVTYTYDSTSIANGKGRLASVSSSVSTYNYSGYDALGRVLGGSQVTDGQTYSMSYAYNLAGSQTSMTYPSGRVTLSGYDAAGRLAGVQDQQSDVYYAGGASTDTTNRVQYAAQGAASVMKLGNGLWEHTSFNNRLQPTQIGLGTSSTDSSTLGLSYDYGTTTNNGNLQSVSYSGGGLSYTQNFGYDSLNRLTTSSENSGSSWSQTNGYDQYGNRWIDFGGGVHNLSFSTSTNRITTSGYTYDAAGNLTNDSIHSYGFDGENKIKSVDGVNDVYRYDGDGNRLRKNFALGEQVRMVYSGGHLLAEYDLSTGALKKEYVYGAKGLIATIEPSTGTRYMTSDHLGSPRVITNSSAGVVSRHDYMPFGEELGTGIGGRTTGMGFSVADGARQKFTLKERDNETGLDYFGVRYYASTQGRFTELDPAPIQQMQLMNPQDLNRYSYVANNPLAFIDPNGAEKIRIIIRTFIPGKSVSIPGISTKDPTLPLPMRREFGGDDRTVGEHPERFRTQQIITLETDPTKNKGCASPLCLSSEAKPGKTRELLAGGREKTGAADVSGMSANAVYPDTKSSDMIVVTATGHAHDPLVEGAPELSYNLDVGLSYGKDGNLYASIHGTKSEFPGIEVFVQRPEGSDKSEQLIQGYNPQDQGRGIWYILGTDKIEGGKLLKQ